MEPEREQSDSSTKVVLIVLGVVGGLVLLCGGGFVICIILITTLGRNASGTFEFVTTKVSSAGGSSAAVGSVEERVIETIAGHLNVNKERVNRKITLRDLAADDLDVVELTMELEDKFQITIPDEDVEKWKSVGDVIDSVEQRLTKKQPGAATRQKKKR